jgi:hypothetical protein
MPMSPGGRFGWEEAAKVKVLVSCAHNIENETFHVRENFCYVWY